MNLPLVLLCVNSLLASSFLRHGNLGQYNRRPNYDPAMQFTISLGCQHLGKCQAASIGRCCKVSLELCRMGSTVRRQSAVSPLSEGTTSDPRLAVCSSFQTDAGCIRHTNQHSLGASSILKVQDEQNGTFGLFRRSVGMLVFIDTCIMHA